MTPSVYSTIHPSVKRLPAGFVKSSEKPLPVPEFPGLKITNKHKDVKIVKPYSQFTGKSARETAL
jgi:hypothetical protein